MCFDDISNENPMKYRVMLTESKPVFTNVILDRQCMEDFARWAEYDRKYYSGLLSEAMMVYWTRRRGEEEKWECEKREKNPLTSAERNLLNRFEHRIYDYKEEIAPILVEKEKDMFNNLLNQGYFKFISKRPDLLVKRVI